MHLAVGECVDFNLCAFLLITFHACISFPLSFTAQSNWETGNETNNPSEFTVALENSDLCEFGFTEPFIFDLWGAVSDAKQGRLQSIQNFDEKF